MEFADIFMNNLIGVLTAISALVALLLEKRKRRADQKQSEADALQGMQTAYDKFVENSNEKLADMNQQIIELKNQLQSANKRILEFELQAEKDKIEIISLRRKIEKYEIELRSYKKSIKK